MTYQQWALKHPQAASDLQVLFGAVPWPTGLDAEGKSEAWAQQKDRLTVARAGGMAWRNNVGATKAKEHHTCPKCSFRYVEKKPPLRYGLANDSAQLNAQIKSADLICAIPRVIRQVDVGTTIAQFGSIESKKPGWVFTGNEHEAGQAAWAALITRLGGFATFSTGDVKL